MHIDELWEEAWIPGENPIMHNNQAFPAARQWLMLQSRRPCSRLTRPRPGHTNTKTRSSLWDRWDYNSKINTKEEGGTEGSRWSQMTESLSILSFCTYIYLPWKMLSPHFHIALILVNPSIYHTETQVLKLELCWLHVKNVRNNQFTEREMFWKLFKLRLIVFRSNDSKLDGWFNIRL